MLPQHKKRRMSVNFLLLFMQYRAIFKTLTTLFVFFSHPTRGFSNLQNINQSRLPSFYFANDRTVLIMRTFLLGLASLALVAAIPPNAYAGDGVGAVQGGQYNRGGGWQGGNGRSQGEGDGGGWQRPGVGGGFGPGGGGPVCLGLAATPQCCQLNALGLAALPCDPRTYISSYLMVPQQLILIDCDTASQQPWDKQSFNQICAANGGSAQCCVLPAVSDRYRSPSPWGEAAHLRRQANKICRLELVSSAISLKIRHTGTSRIGQVVNSCSWMWSSSGHIFIKSG